MDREKGKQTQVVDLRAHVVALALQDDALILTLSKGSPVLIAAHLLEISLEDTRLLGIRKVGVVFNE